MKQTTIGQKILAAVLSHQMGISTDHAMKRYILKNKIHPSWETFGEELLRKSGGGSVPPSDFAAEAKKPELPN